MGLDMYLRRRPVTATEEVGYWRKANHIHKWFVDKVQDGEDDCGEYEVSKEQLQELLETVEAVIASCKLVKGQIKNGQTMVDGKWKDIMEDGEYIEDATIAKKLLPCQEGFFFGGSNYDQYYYNDLVETKKIIEKALSEEGTYYYSSSW